MDQIVCEFYWQSKVAGVFKISTSVLPNKDQINPFVIVDMETKFAIRPFFVRAAPKQLVLDPRLPVLTRPKQAQNHFIIRMWGNWKERFQPLHQTE